MDEGTSWKANSQPSSKAFPALYENWRFIAVFIEPANSEAMCNSS
jgi:hypothetical protein